MTHPADRGACDLDADPCDGCRAAHDEVWPERSEQPEAAVFVWAEEDDDG